MVQDGRSLAVLLSIRPRWARMILTGQKTVEVRRRPPDAQGALLVLYATAPVGAIVGCTRITRVHHGSPSALWERLGAQSAMRKGEFVSYLAGARAPGALELADIKALSPQPLGFRAPQSWLWLDVRNPTHVALLSSVPAPTWNRPSRLRGSL